MPVRAENLPSDDRIQTGTFDNGLKWMYRQHNNPPGRMAMMIHVSSGSLNEKESQRGLAHFLEHMAFNGTENFAPGELIKFFESIGMEFGADLNAFHELQSNLVHALHAREHDPPKSMKA
ncbi:MAG: insulinase family protein [Phycisphaerae bacterium]